jgi:hypothetical protein
MFARTGGLVVDHAAARHDVVGEADMRRDWLSRNARFVAAVPVLVALGFTAAPVATQSAATAVATPAFLQPDRCYKFTFAIPGATNWKVIEVLEGGWIKAEVDAGPAAATREPTWINTAQLVTVREGRCSG